LFPRPAELRACALARTECFVGEARGDALRRRPTPLPGALPRDARDEDGDGHAPRRIRPRLGRHRRRRRAARADGVHHAAGRAAHDAAQPLAQAVLRALRSWFAASALSETEPAAREIWLAAARATSSELRVA